MEAILTYRSNWWGFVAKRLLIAAVVFFVISLMIFYPIYSQPLYDPLLGNESPAAYNQFEKDYITNRSPLITKYYHWLGHFLTGKWGTSLMSDSYYSN
jgi:peptide/nickel transport system permease protein